MSDFSLGSKIKALRNQKGISQEFLADESGLSLRTIQRIESNHSIPRGNTLKRIALALDSSIDDITFIDEDKNEFVSQMNNYKETIYDIKLQVSKKEFDKILTVVIWGGYFALFYFLISILLMYIMRKEIIYLIPLFIGGIAMLFSFLQHKPINKSYFKTSNVDDFQKSIRKLRIHLLKHSKYDGIVGIWFLTTIPAYLKLIFKISIYDNLNLFLIYSLSMFTMLLLIKLFPYDIYKKWDTELENIENSLNKIKPFEA